MLLILLGGGWLFWPFWPSSEGDLSLWQAHDICSGLLGALSPGSCSTVTLLWAAGLAAIALGGLVVFAASLRGDQ